MTIYDSNNKIIYSGEIENGYRVKQIMGENRLYLEFSLPDYIEFPSGCWCEYKKEKYFLLDPQEPTLNNRDNYKYKLVMDTYIAYLKSQVFEFITLDKNPDGSSIPNTDPDVEFALTGTPARFIELLVDNMNSKDTEKGWAVGDYIDSDEITLDFNHTYCFEVLSMLAEAFNTEWEVEGKIIHLRKVEKDKDNPVPLSYGRDNGLEEGIQRVNYKTNIGRVVVKTSDRNIDRSAYGSRTLKMPKNKTLLYEGIEYITDNTGSKIQRKNPVLKGSIIPETTLDLTKIYPRRVGTVSQVIKIDDSKGLYDYIDNGNDIDYTGMIIPGETMTVIFQSGQLSGKEFEVTYKHEEKRFYLVPENDNGLTYPQGSLIPDIGDKYAIFHISLPESYIITASDEVLNEAVKYLYENELPAYTYKMTLDRLFAKRKWGELGGSFNIGNFIRFSDPKLQPVPADIRIISVKEYINRPLQPVLEISNSITGASFSTRMNEIQTQQQTINRVKQETIQYTKRGWRDTQEIIEAVKGMVDDFENSRLSAEVFEGMVLRLGSEGLQFQFLANDWLTAINPAISYNPGTGKLKCPASKIQHMTMGINSVQPGRNISEYMFWTIPEFTTDVLTDKNQPYFLYLKCSKTFTPSGGRNTGTASFFISKDKIMLNDQAGYYTLWVGYLNSESLDGDRSYRSLYGFTEVLPGQITVDKLLSTSGNLVIDLLNGVITAKQGATIQGNIKFLSNGSYQDVGDKFEKTEEKINNIRIGGCNLLRNSELITVNNIAGAGANMTITAEMVQGETYTFSYESTTLSVANDYPQFYIWENGDWLKLQNLGNITSKSRTFIFSRATGKYTFTIYHHSYPQAGTISRLQLEKGNKATDWSPAPEDIQAGIDEAKTVASEARTAAGTASQNIAHLNTYVDGAFKDGVIDNAEAKAIEKYLNTLDETMAQVEATYNKVYANTYLEGTPKTNLLNAKINLFGGRDNLKSSINKAIADSKTTPAEKADVDGKFASFNSLLKAFQNAVEDANKAIQTKLDSISAGYASTARAAADQAQSTANITKTTAETATGRLNNWASDSLISPQEKTALKQQQADIQSEYQDIASQASKYSLTTTTEWSSYYSAYTSAIAALIKYTATTPENIPVTTDYVNIASYYPKRQSILDKIATAAKLYTETLVNNIRIGGRNLLRNSELITVNNIAGAGANMTITAEMVQGETYTLSYESTTLSVAHEYPQFYIWNNSWTAPRKILGTIQAKARTFIWDIATGKYIFTVYHHSYPQAGTITRLQLEKGNKATDWSPAPEDIQAGIDQAQQQAASAAAAATALEYLKTALANRTEIDGGLLLTSLLKLGTFSGQTFTEKAGINGTAVANNDVIAWFGGTLQQAIQNLASIVFRTDGSGQLAKGNISWDASGNPKVLGEFVGKIVSNQNGNRIIIDPEERVIKLMTGSGVETGRWSFYDVIQSSTLELTHKNTNTENKISLSPSMFFMSALTGGYLKMTQNLMSIFNGSKVFEVSVDSLRSTLGVKLIGLPTSSAGLSSGSIWRDGTTLRIVP